ncbi:FMN-dependent NADH-azoreductase [Streptomyces orinoci]|uniref:FMN dependent NADH:quinone oxidoreductase n=1 Tax=Streptomyces orinoci TaxID=67339 RepID=A0ABV3JTM0_STRON|nr:NAD(P)H-dependent oxidoreductase [Streptomyces orinoci]
MTDITARQGFLLHLDSSADAAEDSVTRQLTAGFVTHWRARHGESGYRYRDLAADPVPPLSPAYATLGRRVERQGVIPMDRVDRLVRDQAEERQWSLTRPLIDELRGAHTVLLGVPMYNFTVPATLKSWIDRVSFPGAFTDPDSGRSVLEGTRVVAVVARGGGYGPGTPREPYDFQVPYLRAYFGNLGVAEENLHFVKAELTRAGDIPALARFQDLAKQSLAAAHADLTALAAPAAAVRAGGL